MEDEIIISGISGKFPDSENVWEFRNHLLNNDMISIDDRCWKPGDYGLQERFGKLKGLNKFDEEFFGFGPKFAESLDFQGKTLLEVACEAIYDSGNSLESVRGSKTAVFLSGRSETQLIESSIEEQDDTSFDHEFSLTAAARISYFLDLKGPSLQVITSGSSSLQAVFEAVLHIRSGHSDAALVLETGSGRGEAIVAIFLQRGNAAKRIYATIVNIETAHNGYSEEGLTFPCESMQKELLLKTYDQVKLNPKDVSYIEANGSGSATDDSQELNAIIDVFCRDRSQPLLIGSLKSNKVNAEKASGLCAIVKAIIAMEEEVIPANFHLQNLKSNIKGLTDDRIRIVTKNTNWKGGLVGINNFGIAGTVAHAILRSNSKIKSPEKVDDLKLFAISGRTEKAVDNILTYMENNTDPYLYALWSDIMNKPPWKNNYRGFCIQNSERRMKSIENIPKMERQVWFLYSGFASNCKAMGKDLLQVDICKQQFLNLAKYLKPYNINLIETIEQSTDSDYENDIIKFSIVNTAVQIVLTDTLKLLGINPHGFIGHSTGELLCAFADGCITAEELLKINVTISKYLIETRSMEGVMIAVGRKRDEMEANCPEGLYVVCSNSSHCVTVAGPASKMEEFVSGLKKQKISINKINSWGVAFHTPYVQSSTCTLKDFVSSQDKSILKEWKPKVRSSRWISSTFPEKEWNTPDAQTFDWNFIENNISRPVYFYEALKHVPENSLVIDLSPNGFLLNLLKGEFGHRFVGLKLQHEINNDNLQYFLTTLGKMYIYGADIKISNLYKLPSFPVPKGTPMISPLISWDHSKDYIKYKPSKVNNFIVEISIEENSKDHFLIDYEIDGRLLYPVAGYLVLVWKAFAKSKDKSINKLAVTIENVHIFRSIYLSTSERTTFSITISESSGEFEISHRNNIIVTGRILADEIFNEISLSESFDVNPHEIKLLSSDIYKELRLRGYNYGSALQGIEEADLYGVEGKLKWKENWIIFLDNIFQFTFALMTPRELHLPVQLQQVKIDPVKHEQIIARLNDAVIPIKHHQYLKLCTAGGVEVRGLKTMMVKRNIPEPLTYDSTFIPYTEERCFRDLPEMEKKIETYYELCSQKTEQIINKMKSCKNLGKKLKFLLSKIERVPLEKDINLNVIEELQKSKLNISLFQTLDDILSLQLDECFLQKTQDLLDHLFTKEKADNFLTVYFNNRIIRPYLQTIYENAITAKPVIVEINCENFNFGYKALTSFPSDKIKPKYYLVSTDNKDVTDISKNSSDVEQSIWDIESSQFSIEAHLIIAIQLFSRHSERYRICLKNIYDSLSNGGFLLLLEPKKSNFIYNFLNAIRGAEEMELLDPGKLKEVITNIGFKLVGSKSDGFFYDLYLLRKQENKKRRFVNIDDESFEWIKEIQNLLPNLNPDESLWLISQNNPTSGILGLVSSLRREAGGNNIRCIFDMKSTIDFPNSESRNKTTAMKKDFAKTRNGAAVNDSNTTAETQDNFLEILLDTDLVQNVIKDFKWCSFSFLPCINDDKLIDTEYAYIKCMQSGDFSSLRWIESPLKYEKQRHLYHVYYCALNFRDIMLASGRLSLLDVVPGCSGTEDSLLGMEFSGCDNKGQRVMGVVPDGKAFATIVPSDVAIVWPVPNEWTLEEAATVPMAYATAYYALLLRAKLKVNDTVLIHCGSGGIGQAAITIALHLGCRVYATVGSQQERNFLIKRFPLLKENIFASSEDNSFELHILNKTEGKGVDVVLNSLSEDKLEASVRCLSINGRFLEIGNHELTLNNRLRMAMSLKNISFHKIGLELDSSKSVQKELYQLMADGIEAGAVQPLNSKVFDKYQWEEAFRFMVSGQYIGKILVKIRNENLAKSSICSPFTVQALRQVYCDPRKCYIITGGLGGFGFELVNWLISRGAKVIVLNSRSGLKNSYQKLWMQLWKKTGIQVVLNQDDISTLEGANLLISKSKAMMEIGGIFHLAMVLIDKTFKNMSPELFYKVYNPKANGARNLDALTRQLCPTMQWFVGFSSIMCAIGNKGQTNYGFANSVIERICEKRREDGFHGLAIQWGAIGDVGAAFDNWKFFSKFTSILLQPMSSCTATLETFLNQDSTVVLCFMFKGALDQKPQMTAVEKVRNILGITDDSQEFDENLSLSDLGLHSLVIPEVQAFLERNLNCYLSSSEIKSLSLEKLRQIEEKNTA